MTPSAPDGGQDAQDLCAFIDASPSPFHAVGEMRRRLDAAGFAPLDERQRWELAPGARGYVVRDGSIAAVTVGRRSPVDAGFRVVGAHTDSPTFKVRPTADVDKHGYAMVGVEVYGGPLVHTWMDRDLTVAGRLTTRDGASHLINLDGAPLRMASLAIHLDREVWEKGIQLDRQRHLVPMWSAHTSSAVGFAAALAEAAHVDADEVLGHDLVLADTQPARLGGRDGEFVLAPRQDNLTSCHAALSALLDVDAADATQVVVCNDHEEVGSGSAEGARGPFLEDVLRRVLAATDDHDPQSLPRAVAGSVLVSADSAHAVHPNYADRHEGTHQPRLGGGPVIKLNANQSYATDGPTAAWFAARCGDAGVAVQRFVNRGDLPGGSTIGPLTATRLGLPTVDVGAPLLSMHSVREQGASADVPLMIRALAAHLGS